MKSIELSASQEDYLETIFFLSREDSRVRPKAIADGMRVRAASVTGALKVLSEKGLVNYSPYASVTLTDEGRERARSIAVKHEALLHFFTQVLGIDRTAAEDFACSMEHNIPDDILQRFVQFAEYTEKCPNFNASWQNSSEAYFCRAQDCTSQRCEECHLPEN